MISQSLTYLIAACTLFVLAASPSVSAAPEGFLEGHLKIVSYTPVQPADQNVATVTAETPAQYALIVLSRSKRKQIARITADANGNYRAALPPGDYVLDVEGRVAKRLRIRAQPFTVVANETVHVDITIVTGFASE
jgi:hypothetical protein